MNVARSVAVLGIGLVTTACAGNGTPSQTARLAAAYVTKVADDGERFAAFRGDLARSRLAIMQLLEANALEIEQQNDMDIRIWKEASQSSRVALYDTIRELSQHAEEQATEFRWLREDHERALAATKSAVTVRSDKLTATAKTLAELAKERALEDELAFYKDFFTRVRAGIDDLEAKAKTDAAAAQTTAAEQAKALRDAQKLK
jgi:hypothetical protein